jgi:hypothetical protein
VEEVLNTKEPERHTEDRRNQPLPLILRSNAAPCGTRGGRVDLREAIEGWNGFYAAVANASAALLGLVFVGVSIRLARPPLDTRTRMLGTESVVNLLHPVLAALGMLLPVEPAAQGFGLLILSTAGIAATTGIAYVQIRQPSHERRLWLAYRYFIPLLAAVILTVGAIGLIVGWRVAIYAPALYVFLMLIIGTQNAWDLLLGRPEGRPRNDHA